MVSIKDPDDFCFTSVPKPVIPHGISGVRETLVEDRAESKIANGSLTKVSSTPQSAATITDDLFKYDSQMWELANRVRYSSFLPEALRSKSSDSSAQNQADAYIMMQKAISYGLSPTDAFDQFSVHIDKNGFSRLGMSVQKKAELCSRYGFWKISFDAQHAVAKVVGCRNMGEEVEVTYSGYEAAINGFMRKSPQTGCWEGIGKWEHNWPEMLKKRALGLFLDQVFPDVLECLDSDVNDNESVDVQADTLSATTMQESKNNKYGLETKSTLPLIIWGISKLVEYLSHL